MSNKFFPILTDTIKDFIEDMRESIFQGYEELSDVNIMQQYIKNLGPAQLSQSLIKKFLPHKDLIEKKDMKIVAIMFTIFGHLLSKEKIKYYSDLFFDEERVSANNKDAIFLYLHNIASILEQIKKIP
jgi:hypothetical protein